MSSTAFGGNPSIGALTKRRQEAHAWYMSTGVQPCNRRSRANVKLVKSAWPSIQTWARCAPLTIRSANARSDKVYHEREA